MLTHYIESGWGTVTVRRVDLWLLVTALADIATTAVGIEVFGLVEANGIPATIMHTFGVWAFVPVKALVFGFILYEYCWIRSFDKRSTDYAGYALVAVAGLLGLVPALWNLSLMLSV